jgi:transglutaminase-like putative cysteine protease
MKFNQSSPKSSLTKKLSISHILLTLVTTAIVLFAAMGCSPTTTPDTPPPSEPTFVVYDLVHTIDLENIGSGEASRINIWVALIRSISPYQEVLSMEITPEDYSTLSDNYENDYAVFEFKEVPAGEIRQVEINYKVKVHRLDFELGECSGTVPDEYINSEQYIESDSDEIQEKSNELSAGKANLCEKSRAFYDFVGDNMAYVGYNPGDIGAAAALETLGGDCTEFTDLSIALNRAAGIPARYFTGVTCCTDMGYREGENKHNWLDVNLPGSGWVPIDPTWGRFSSDRERYFAGITPDHIIVTEGRYLTRLSGYFFYRYRYFWDDEATDVSSNEKWSILKGSE